MSGWFAVKRGITEHPVFKGDMAKIGFFLWLMENAAYKAVEIDIGGKPYTVPRGSLCFSQRFMASKAGMTVKSLRTFLSALESHGIISIQVVQTGTARETTRTQVTLCNYEKYQSMGNNRETTGKQPGNKEEQGNNIPVGGADAPDPDKVLFDSGVRLLTAAGILEKNARQMLGKWRRDHGTEAVIAAIGMANREGAVEPKAFMEGCLKFRAKKAKPEIGQTRTTPDGRKQVYVNHYDGWVQEYA